MGIALEQFVRDFAAGLVRADARRPQARNSRSGVSFQPGIGPHTEPRTVELVMAELAILDADAYRHYSTAVSYPGTLRLKCDLCLGLPPSWLWAFEVKMLRFKGDNGKPSDEQLAHLLSPYPEDHSTLTDCEKLAQSGLAERDGILIYGFDHPDRSMDPAIEAFEVLARTKLNLGSRATAVFHGLIHPVHRDGRVFGWELVRD